jgi:hypothetical protein
MKTRNFGESGEKKRAPCALINFYLSNFRYNFGDEKEKLCLWAAREWKAGTVWSAC